MRAGKNYNVAVPANELASINATGLNTLIAANPDAWTAGTIITIVNGYDDPPTAGNLTQIFCVMDDDGTKTAVPFTTV